MKTGSSSFVHEDAHLPRLDVDTLADNGADVLVLLATELDLDRRPVGILDFHLHQRADGAHVGDTSPTGRRLRRSRADFELVGPRVASSVTRLVVRMLRVRDGDRAELRFARAARGRGRCSRCRGS